MPISKISEGAKVEGQKQEITFGMSKTQESVETVTLLQMLRSGQNAGNELVAWQNKVTEVWTGLTKAQKADYQDEYDKLFSYKKI